MCKIVLFFNSYIIRVVVEVKHWWLHWKRWVRGLQALTHSYLVTSYDAQNYISITSNNGLAPSHRQAINWTNADTMSIISLWTNFSEIWIRLQIFSFKNLYLKISSAKGRPFCQASISQWWLSPGCVQLPWATLSHAVLVDILAPECSTWSRVWYLIRPFKCHNHDHLPK